MDKRYQIFVSSTYTDLKDEREIVIQTLIRMGCIPSGMELFPAADEEQFEYIKKVIDDCDYYLLIIGGRYGSTTAEGLSYTEKEYDYAVKKKIKVIALIHGNPDEIPSGKTETNPKLRKKLEAFRNKVAKNRLVNFWTEANRLEGYVALNVADAIRMYPAVGWVRANQVSNTELLTELNELRKNKERLQVEIETLKANSDISVFTAHEESEFNYIFSKINGYHTTMCRATILDSSFEMPKHITKKCNIKFSLIRVLYQNIQNGEIKFDHSFFRFLDDEIKVSKPFIDLIKQGYKFSAIVSEARLGGDGRLRGNLTALGFISIETRMRSEPFRGASTSYNAFPFSEKLCRFVSWLDYYNKIESEPMVEFIEFIELN